MNTMIITCNKPSSDFPSWMNGTWNIFTVDSVGVTLGASAPESLEFVSSSSQTIPPGPVWGTLYANTVTSGATTVKGASHGRPFHLDYDAVQMTLTCRLDPRPHWGWTLALGAAIGTLVGAGIGAVAGFPVLPLVAILASSVTASAMVAVFLLRRVVPGGGVRSEGKINGPGGPPATWVANDGGAARRFKPGQPEIRQAREAAHA
jgi:hypothetical protein